jgi:hypothetical protein
VPLVALSALTMRSESPIEAREKKATSFASMDRMNESKDGWHADSSQFGSAAIWTVIA